MKDLLSLPARNAAGVLVVLETPAAQAAHGDAPRDVFVKKDLRFLGWGGIDEAEALLSAAEQAARGGPR